MYKKEKRSPCSRRTSENPSEQRKIKKPGRRGGAATKKQPADRSLQAVSQDERIIPENDYCFFLR